VLAIASQRCPQSHNDTGELTMATTTTMARMRLPPRSRVVPQMLLFLFPPLALTTLPLLLLSETTAKMTTTAIGLLAPTRRSSATGAATTFPALHVDVPRLVASSSAKIRPNRHLFDDRRVGQHLICSFSPPPSTKHGF